MDLRVFSTIEVLKRYDNFEQIGDYPLWIVRKGKFFGIFSTEKRTLLLPVSHENIVLFSETICLVHKNKKCGLYCIKTKRWVLHIMFDSIEHMATSNLCKLAIGKKLGIYSEDSRRVNW